MRISIRSLIEVKSRIRSFMDPDPQGSEQVDPELHGKSEKWIRIRMKAKSQHWLFNLSAGERWTQVPESTECFIQDQTFSPS